MSVKFTPTIKLTRKDKLMVSEMTGKIMLWIMERRSPVYMAERLNMDVWQVERNIDETLYEYRKYVGWRRYLKILFIK